MQNNDKEKQHDHKRYKITANMQSDNKKDQTTKKREICKKKLPKKDYRDAKREQSDTK